MRPTIAIDVNLVEGRFFQIQLHCGFDQVRMFFVLQFFVYSEFVNSSCYPCFNCWCGLRHGCKGVNLVTSIRQPIHGPHPLILDAPQHRQLDFIFLPSVGPFHFGWNRKKSSFQYSFGRRMCSISWKTEILVSSIFFCYLKFTIITTINLIENLPNLQYPIIDSFIYAFREFFTQLRQFSIFILIIF